MTWSIAGVVESTVRTVLRPLEDAGKILFDAANYVADWEADLLAAEEAEREAWDENELRDVLNFDFNYALVTSVDPVECGHPSAPGEEGPGAADASQRAASGQPQAEWDEFLRRWVREEISALLSSVADVEVDGVVTPRYPAAESSGEVVPSASPEHPQTYADAHPLTSAEIARLRLLLHDSQSSVVAAEVTAESPEPAGGTAGSGHLNLYPTDLYDAVRVLEMALERDELLPVKHFRPLVDRIKKAADEM